MNADIRISVDFWSHPKTGRLMRAAGVRGVRSLQILWMWAARNRPDGRLPGFDAADIEFAADWRGKKGAFFAAVRGEWLDETDEGCALHDWQEHNPWAADADLRSQKALFSKLAQVNPEAHRALKARGIGAISRDEYESWKAERGGGSLANAPRTPGESLAPSPSPSPFPKEEKEREVRETASADAAAAGPPSAPIRPSVSEGSATAASVPATEIVEIVEIVEAREDGSDETLAENVAPAPTAIAITPEARGTAEQTTELAAEPGSVADEPSDAESAADEPVAGLAVEPGSVADEPSDAESAADEPVATALADAAPSDPASAALAAPVPRPDPAGDATRHPADGAADGASDRPDTRSVAPDTDRPRRRRSPEPVAMPDPPPWLPAELWARWLAHRREIRKPMTTDGALMLLAQLEKARGFGHDPAELVRAAIAGGWQGCVFADRHYRPAPAPNATGPARASARRPLRDLPADPAVYREAAGFETELAVEEVA